MINICKLGGKSNKVTIILKKNWMNKVIMTKNKKWDDTPTPMHKMTM